MNYYYLYHDLRVMMAYNLTGLIIASIDCKYRHVGILVKSHLMLLVEESLVLLMFVVCLKSMLACFNDLEGS